VNVFINLVINPSNSFHTLQENYGQNIYGNQNAPFTGSKEGIDFQPKAFPYKTINQIQAGYQLNTTPKIVQPPIIDPSTSPNQNRSIKKKKINNLCTMNIQLNYRILLVFYLNLILTRFQVISVR